MEVGLCTGAAPTPPRACQQMVVEPATEWEKARAGEQGRVDGRAGCRLIPVPAPGLCGNFNQNQADDFLSLSGVVEGTAAAFANTWKTQAACPNVRNSFEDPCALSVENGTPPWGPSGCCPSARGAAGRGPRISRRACRQQGLGQAGWGAGTPSPGGVSRCPASSAQAAGACGAEAGGEVQGGGGQPTW